MADNAEKAAVDALYRLFDQALNTAGDAKGRTRVMEDFLTVRDAVTSSASTPEEGN